MITHILLIEEIMHHVLRISHVHQLEEHTMQETLLRLFRYKAWANDELLTVLADLGNAPNVTGLAVKAFLNHTYIVDRIFAAHLRCANHEYTTSNPS